MSERRARDCRLSRERALMNGEKKRTKRRVTLRLKCSGVVLVEPARVRPVEKCIVAVLPKVL